MTENLVYRAEVIDENDNRTTYTGLTGNTFKARHYRHRSSFKHRKLENDTTLASHIWTLKDNNLNYQINWSEVCRAPRFNPITRKYRLCIRRNITSFSNQGGTAEQKIRALQHMQAQIKRFTNQCLIHVVSLWYDNLM